ncbi:T9SS type A sorting domain-containing protein [Tamlana sp. 2201CG12-4]|uniref:T9SS type A sorting domain-containing protein n=1 Tax=Tamlana sp. 2201CG12-4 TaxID=3112582 RepID=UPI003FA3AEFB
MVGEDLYIYPNPVNQILYIHLDKMDNTPTEVLVYNTLGALMLNKKELIKGHQVSVNMFKLPPGIYFVKVISGKTNKTVKIVKR